MEGGEGAGASRGGEGERDRAAEGERRTVEGWGAMKDRAPVVNDAVQIIEEGEEGEWLSVALVSADGTRILVVGGRDGERWYEWRGSETVRLAPFRGSCPG